MPRAYKTHNKTIIQRSANGRFRQTLLSELVEGVNEKQQVFICNVCGREFMPVMLEGICCGVNNKRPKPERIPSPEEQALLVRIQVIRDKPFINLQDLHDIQKLEMELYWAKRRSIQEGPQNPNGPTPE